MRQDRCVDGRTKVETPIIKDDERTNRFGEILKTLKINLITSLPSHLYDFYIVDVIVHAVTTLPIQYETTFRSLFKLVCIPYKLIIDTPTQLMKIVRKILLLHYILIENFM